MNKYENYPSTGKPNEVFIGIEKHPYDKMWHALTARIRPDAKTDRMLARKSGYKRVTIKEVARILAEIEKADKNED